MTKRLLDCETGAMRTVHTEVAMEGGWINLHDSFRVLSRTASTLTFLWPSERDGYRHIYALEVSEAMKERPNPSLYYQSFDQSDRQAVT